MARRTLLIIASILLAALGTALIWLYVQGAENRAQQSAQLVPALFLTRDVAAGQSPATSVAAAEVPPAVAANAVTSTADLGNKTLTVPALKGQVLLKTMLGTSGANAANFPAGGVASLTITDPNRVPAELSAGDVVDVVRLTKDGADILLSDITVRSVGPAGQGTAEAGVSGSPGTAGNATVPPSIVGLNVSRTDAVKLYDAVARGDQMAIYLHGAQQP